MKKHLLPQCNSYKANLHCHTNVSDGAMSPEQVKQAYKSLGYSVVAYTDHDVLIPHDDLNDPDFLALHGLEIEIDEPRPNTDFKYLKTCHFCLIAIDPDNLTQPMWHREKFVPKCSLAYRDKVKFDESEPDYERVYSADGISEMMRIGRERGFFVTYNHPTWSLEEYPQYTSYKGMHAMEMFNGACIFDGYDDYNPRVYDDILRSGNRILCIGADDNHSPSHVGRAYTVIKAPSLQYRDITAALVNGDFYASEGPEIKELCLEDGTVHIKTSAAQYINISCGIRRSRAVVAPDGDTVTEASFALPDGADYFRLTVIAPDGKRACTNAYFVDETEK